RHGRFKKIRRISRPFHVPPHGYLESNASFVGCFQLRIIRPVEQRKLRLKAIRRFYTLYGYVQGTVFSQRYFISPVFQTGLLGQARRRHKEGENQRPAKKEFTNAASHCEFRLVLTRR